MKVGGKGRPPSQRPSKVCPVCQRPFSWRKKWARVWDQVIYCSERCRQRRPEDVTAFNNYRAVIERYELQYLKQMQRDRDTSDFTNRDINSTVLDKAIGIR